MLSTHFYSYIVNVRTVCVLLMVVILIMYTGVYIQDGVFTGTQAASDNGDMRFQDVISIQGSMTFVYNTTEIRKRIEKIHANYYKPVEGDTCIQRNPHTIIVGVSKCGTRELSDLMAMHPQMVTKGTYGRYKIAENKFTTEMKRKTVKRKMPCTYSDQVASMKQDFLFLHSDVPANIAALDTRTKIMVLVREPVERLLAQATFKTMGNNNSVNDVKIEHFMRHDSHTGVLKLNPRSKLIQASLYSECLKRYLKYFPLEQILIIETEQFSKETFAVMAEVERFLGVEPFAYEEHLVLNKETGFNCVRETVDATEAVCYGRTRGRGGNTGLTISNAERQLLVDYFRPFKVPRNPNF